MVFDIQDRQQRTLVGVAIAFSIVPNLAIGARILARRVANRVLDWSDYLIISAGVALLLYWSSTLTAAFAGGLGYHAADIIALHGQEPVVILYKAVFINQLLWAVTGCLCKISILVLYAKLFSFPPVILLARLTGAFVILFELATVIVTLFICQPIAFSWDTSIAGQCGDQMLSFRITGSLNVVSDAIVLVLPLKWLVGLQLELYRKVVLIVTFALGVFTCIVSIIRLVTLSSIDFNDGTYSLVDPIIWSGLEPSVAITLACIPLLRPLLGRSKYTATGTVRMRTLVRNRLANSAYERRSNNFRQLEENNSSQFRLRPVGPENDTNVSASVTQTATGSRGNEVERDDSFAEAEREGVQGGRTNEREAEGSKGIAVKQEWRVTSETVAAGSTDA